MTPEQRAARLYHHMYESCEGICEQSERIVALEELTGTLYFCATSGRCDECAMGDRKGNLLDDDVCEGLHLSMRELGIEVDE